MSLYEELVPTYSFCLFCGRPVERKWGIAQGESTGIYCSKRCQERDLVRSGTRKASNDQDL